MMFRLEPHHLPPGSDAVLEAPAEAVLELEWKGKKREVAFRWMRFGRFAHLLWVRVDGELWLATQHPRTSFEAPMKWRLPQRSPRKLLSIARTIEGGHALGLARAFFQAAPIEPQFVMSRADGRGVWLDSNLEIVGEFAPESEANADSTAWKKAFEAAYNDEASDARVAWNWAAMSDDERRAWLYEGSHGLNAIEKIVRLVLQSADELWEHHEGLCWAHDFSWVEGALSNEQGWFIDARKEAPRLERWRRFVDKRLWKPRFWMVARHRLVRQWIQSEHPSWDVRVEVSKPSFHERLEARLELRAWLDQNTSLQQRRWLLPP